MNVKTQECMHLPITGLWVSYCAMPKKAVCEGLPVLIILLYHNYYLING